MFLGDTDIASQVPYLEWQDPEAHLKMKTQHKNTDRRRNLNVLLEAQKARNAKEAVTTSFSFTVFSV